MRIGIDVRYLSHGLVGGVHTYVANFVPALIKLAPHHEFYLYADTKRPFELQGLPDNVTIRYLPWRTPLSSIYNDLFLLGDRVARDSLDVMHFAGNYGFGPATSRTAITLQDEINLLPLSSIFRGHPKNLRTMAMMMYLHYCTQAALRRADLVISISEYSKRQIAHYSRIDPQKIVSVPHACPLDIMRIENPDDLADVRKRLGLTRPFVLAEASKNPGVLVKAWGLLPGNLRKGTEIVFFSRSSGVLPIVQAAVSDGYARVLVRPARHDLSALYSMAQAFVFPSWIEGFGIPLLEAMTCGAPVVASDRGAIPEVVGDAALLVDAEDAPTLAQHLTSVLTAPAEAQQLRARGFARASQFSWTGTAQRILSAYEKAVNGRQIGHQSGK